MYPYYANPWQLMAQAQQLQNLGYPQPYPAMPQQVMQQPYSTMPQQMMQQPQMPPQMAMPPMHYHLAQMMQQPQMPPQMAMPPMHYAPQAMPMQQAPIPPMPQIAAPAMQHAPQPLPPINAAPINTPINTSAQAEPQLQSRQDVDTFIEDDEDDFDQERYDAIKARIRKLRGALRETA